MARDQIINHFSLQRNHADNQQGVSVSNATFVATLSDHTDQSPAFDFGPVDPSSVRPAPSFDLASWQQETTRLIDEIIVCLPELDWLLGVRQLQEVSEILPATKATLEALLALEEHQKTSLADIRDYQQAWKAALENRSGELAALDELLKKPSCRQLNNS